MRFFLALIFAFSVFAVQAHAVGYEDIVMVSPQGLKAMLDSGRRVVILDVRSRGAYGSSDLRIKGDTRIAPDELVERAWEIPMGSEIVTYCT